MKAFIKFIAGKVLLVFALLNFCLIASEGTWDTGEKIFTKFSGIQAIGPCDFTMPILSDTPRDMFGRAERARMYLSKLKMRGRNVVTVLGDPHIFVSSLEPCYSDWCGSNMLGFIDAFATNFDSAFIKGFLKKSAEIEGKISKFNTSYLKDILGTSNKELLAQCLLKASENTNLPLLHKAISDRIKGIPNLSGYAFFKELVEVIEAGNIKLCQVTPWENGPKIKHLMLFWYGN